jgi:beta-aspartyl-peptidase (threonine type)
MNQRFAIAIHGGAGTLNKAAMTERMMAGYKLGLETALNAGLAVLRLGGPAIAAVEEAVVSLENNPLFNAGKGAVLTSEGKHEMDAAIMDGSNLSAGAVASISGLKNPVRLAKQVMENSKYVFLCGKGAIEFARQQQLEFEPDDYFMTSERKEELDNEKKQETDKERSADLQKLQNKKFGTVGAVALDEKGNLAAATSTGGLTNKKFGRVGDTPLIGAGTYANNQTCAVSCTGEGEEFIRAVIAYDVSCLMEYKGLSLRDACREAMQGKLQQVKGSGGLIALDNLGTVETPFNTEGMYRASFCGTGRLQISIFDE